MKNVVVCGGGIIGCATAYYLSELDVDKSLKITVVEREGVACHSSGKAGGFLALDWNDHSPVGPLARLSYKMHEELSQSLRNQVDEDVGYRCVNTFSLEARASKAKQQPSGKPESWTDGNIVRKKPMGDVQTTSQVHPFLLTNALMKAALQKGATLTVGKVVNGVAVADGNQVTKVLFNDGTSLDADVVVIALGAWSSLARDFFPLCKTLPVIRGSRAHSIILEADVPPEAMFLNFTDSSNRSKDSEIYPRPDGTVYVCGEDDDEPLPDDPKEVAARAGAGENLQNIAGEVSSVLKAAKIKAKQACYLPCSPDGLPVIGRIPGYEGAFIATGHGCWGILNGPATGKCMAQMILGKPVEIDISKLSMSRFL